MKVVVFVCRIVSVVAGVLLHISLKSVGVKLGGCWDETGRRRRCRGDTSGLGGAGGAQSPHLAKLGRLFIARKPQKNEEPADCSDRRLGRSGAKFPA